MTTQPLHGIGVPSVSRIPRTPNAVAEALPPAQRKRFLRQMGRATEEEIAGVLRRWWLRVQLYGDPATARTRSAVAAGTAPGRPLLTVLRELGGR